MNHALCSSCAESKNGRKQRQDCTIGSRELPCQFVLGSECFHPSVVLVMTNGYSTRSEDRKTYVPTFSELHRRHGRAKQFCSKTDCNGSCCAYDVLRSHEHGKPMALPQVPVVRLQSRVFSLTMVHSCGRPAKELVAAKRHLRCPRQRESGSWRRRSRICSNSFASLHHQQQDKAKLKPLRSTTLRWTPAESKVNSLRSQIKDLKS